MGSGSLFDSLGDELVAGVLGWLPPAQLAAAELCCRRWRAVSEGHGLWQRHAAATQAQLRGVPAGLPRGWPAAACSGPRWAGLSWKQRWLETQFLLAAADSSDPSRPYGYLERATVLIAHPLGAAVTAVAACGGRLVSASTDRTAKVWCLDSLRLLAMLPHPAPPLFAAFPSPDLLLTATPGGGFLWRLGPEGSAPGAGGAPGSSSSGGGGSTGAQLVRRLGDASSLGRADVKCAAAWDMFLAAGMGDGSIRIYDIYSGALTKLLRLHSRPLTALAHVAHGEWDLLISAAVGEPPRFTDVETGLQLAEAKLPPSSGADRRLVTALAVEPCRGQLVAAVHAEQLACWDCGRGLGLIPTPLQRVELEGPKVLRPLAAASCDRITQLAVPAFGGCGCFIASGEGDSQLEARLWHGLTHLDSDPLPALCMLCHPELSQPSSLVVQTARRYEAAAGLPPWRLCEELHPAGCGDRRAAAPPCSGGSAGGVPSRAAAAAGLPHDLGDAMQLGVVKALLDRNERGPLAQFGRGPEGCTCISTAQLPLMTGHRDGQVVLWSWRQARP